MGPGAGVRAEGSGRGWGIGWGARATGRPVTVTRIFWHRA
jgi:hypothetical protein